MTKGKPWTIEQETELRKLVEANTPIDLIATKLGKNPPAIFVKIRRLGLQTTAYKATLSSIPMPKELPTAEEALRILAGAMQMSCTPGLSKVEVDRLHVVAILSKNYKEFLADFIRYREIEAKLIEMEQKYGKLLEQTSKNNENKPDSSQNAET